jgi:DnaJ-domain-containing protein 1
MSIGKRLIDLARAELNSLLERAADGDEDERDDRWGGDLGGMSDSELEAELERRRRARDEAEEAARGPRPSATSGGAGAASGSRRASTSARPEPPRRTPAGDQAIRRAYAALEIPPGSDFETVRKAYRRLMRKYHPDLHGGSPEAQRAANDLAQRLTESYKLLEKQTRR